MKKDILGCFIIQQQHTTKSDVERFDHKQFQYLIENKTTYISHIENLQTDTLCTVDGVHRLMREGRKCESRHLLGIH